MFGAFVDFNVRIARRIDGWLPRDYRTDGNTYFLREMAPGFLARDLTIYDLGSGSNPLISTSQKTELGLYVVGLDISADELAAAPAGSYDRTIVADLTKFHGDGDADVVICQSTLEHVDDAPGAVRAIGSCLKPGGTALIFLPCRNALFARINLLLPEALKRRILFTIYPHADDGHYGFPALYDKATPREYREMAQAGGLQVVETKLFWKSSYFHFFLPFYVLWRLTQALARLVLGENACETFAMVLRKPHS